MALGDSYEVQRIKANKEQENKLHKDRGGRAEISCWEGCCAINYIRYPRVDNWVKFNEYLHDYGENPTWMYTCPLENKEDYKLRDDMVKSGWAVVSEVPSKEGPYNIAVMQITFHDLAFDEDLDYYDDDRDYYDGGDDDY